ncbi:hypothetical protein FRC17_009903 [Serendipita sp. 399]|nr:hypothetical protein FRC17_009903 [Serendipita sp. 399]
MQQSTRPLPSTTPGRSPAPVPGVRGMLAISSSSPPPPFAVALSHHDPLRRPLESPTSSSSSERGLLASRISGGGRPKPLTKIRYSQPSSMSSSTASTESTTSDRVGARPVSRQVISTEPFAPATAGVIAEEKQPRRNDVGVDGLQQSFVLLSPPLYETRNGDSGRREGGILRPLSALSSRSSSSTSSTPSSTSSGSSRGSVYSTTNGPGRPTPRRERKEEMEDWEVVYPDD